jgi:hypothetical protein
MIMDNSIGQQKPRMRKKYKSKRDEITSNVYEINKVNEAVQYLHDAS